jgi:hypothetical protein
MDADGGVLREHGSSSLSGWPSPRPAHPPRSSRARRWSKRCRTAAATSTFATPRRTGASTTVSRLRATGPVATRRRCGSRRRRAALPRGASGTPSARSEWTADGFSAAGSIAQAAMLFLAVFYGTRRTRPSPSGAGRGRLHRRVASAGPTRASLRAGAWTKPSRTGGGPMTAGRRRGPPLPKGRPAPSAASQP